ncbi:MAG: GNAT family N-acetyltransferase [Mobilitalea sp.]
MLKAVIFDMDGVIIDSEPMHAKAAVLALEKYGVKIELEYVLDFIGSTTYYMCQKMIEDFHIEATPEELLDANNEAKKYLLDKSGYIVIPFIIELMNNLHQHGLKLIIASSSSAQEIEAVMQTLNIKDYFDGYVSGTTVKRPKPAPDIFLEAANRLGIDPNECLIIEDSSHGVSAADSAGITCVGFINPGSGNQDLSKAAFLVEGFEEVDYDFLVQVYQYAHMEPVTILTTDRCIIRELSVDDIDCLYPIYQNPRIKMNLDNVADSIEEEKEKHLAYIKNIYHFYGFGLWGVFLKENGCLLGRCGIELKTLDGEAVYELGYLLNPDYQGYGYAREFVTAIIKYCFTHLEIPRIIAVIDSHNLSSVKLAEMVGMKKIGECVRKDHTFDKYEILRILTNVN